MPRGGATEELRHLVRTPAGRVLVGAVLAIALATLIGLAVLWPHGQPPPGPDSAAPTTLPARVDQVVDYRCPGTGAQTCRRLIVDVGSVRARLSLGPVTTASTIGPGDRIRVIHNVFPAGTPGVAAIEPYSYYGVDRHASVLLLAAALALLALVALWWRGLFAVVGVGLSLLLLTRFVVPALLEGHSALLVALVGSLAVMFVTVTLTNGIGAQTFAAALGIAATLVLTSVLAVVAAHVADLDGRSTELAGQLSISNPTVSLQGVVIAGMVIGALGVLADTAVTQASAVMALRRASPELTAAGLYRSALTVGRDHLSATIHTLVLAYAGASLPLLLVLHASATNVTDAINLQDTAEPIIATVVGCAGLIAAVPFTTGLAALLISHVPGELLPDAHTHAH